MTKCRRGSVVEHLIGNEEVMGSIPIVGSDFQIMHHDVEIGISDGVRSLSRTNVRGSPSSAQTCIFGNALLVWLSNY